MTVECGDYEWDSDKNLANIKKHGFSFEEIIDVFEDPFFYEIPDYKNSTMEERRLIGIGNIRGLLVVTTVFTERTKTRIISSRRATKLEESAYYDQQKNINA